MIGHELGAGGVEADALEVAGVEAQEVVFVVEAGGGKVGGLGVRGGRFGGCGWFGWGLFGLSGSFDRQRCDQTENQHAHGVPPSCSMQHEDLAPGRYPGFYNTA
jgi:hypothetical protein